MGFWDDILIIPFPFSGESLGFMDLMTGSPDWLNWGHLEVRPELEILMTHEAIWIVALNFVSFLGITRLKVHAGEAYKEYF